MSDDLALRILAALPVIMCLLGYFVARHDGRKR